MYGSGVLFVVGGGIAGAVSVQSEGRFRDCHARLDWVDRCLGGAAQKVVFCTQEEYRSSKSDAKTCIV